MFLVRLIAQWLMQYHAEQQEPEKDSNIEKQNAKENAFAKLAKEQAKAQQARSY